MTPQSRRLLTGLLAAGLCLAGASSADESRRLHAKEAKEHVGEVAAVCGVVVSANYSARTKGQPTFLNLDEPYPTPVFTIVIWGTDRAKFGEPERTYQGKKICVTGQIKSYRGSPQIVATTPGQIRTD